MQLIINIPDNIAPTVVDNICTATNYNPASGVTKNQHAKAEAINAIKQLSRTGAMIRARKAEDSASGAIS